MCLSWFALSVGLERSEARIRTTCRNDAVILRKSLMVDKEVSHREKTRVVFPREHLVAKAEVRALPSLLLHPQLNPTKVHRSIEIDESDDTLLVVKLDATEVRLLRPAISTLMDLAEAASKTIEAFAH